MRYLILIGWLVIVGTLSQACQKEFIDIDLAANSWRIEGIKKSGQLTFESTENKYILRFTSDTIYTLSLDVNTCLGLYGIPDQGKIDMNVMACTEVCCDSEFAEELSLLLPKMTRYYSKGEELHFEGKGKIILKRFQE